ncbi:MAG TPA: hypothetical protein ACQGQH_10375 [Xylella sp.]
MRFRTLPNLPGHEDVRLLTKGNSSMPPREGCVEISNSSLEPSMGGINVLVVNIPFAGPPSVPQFFWTELSGPDNKKLAYIKFERRLFIRSESLFVATEWRPADSGDSRPEPFLRFSGFHMPISGRDWVGGPANPSYRQIGTPLSLHISK